MKNKILVLVLGFIFLVLTIQNISSIGITPGRTTVNFEPGLTKDVSFSIINSEHKDMSVVFMVRGDLADYVTLARTYTEISKDEDSKSFSYAINLPQRIEKPGLYEIEIVALEAPSDIKEKGTFVGATVSVVTQLHIYVPYPDKFLDADINVVESEGKTNFLIPVVNRGKLDIAEAKAVIDIYDGAENKIDSIETNSLTINSLERKELSVTWDVGVNPGRYKAIVTIRFDNEISTVLKEFNVGEMFLEVLEINVKDFSLGEIAKFDALIENKWSSNLRDVYLNIVVYNAEGEVMADFKSPTYDIGKLTKSELVAYWDTAGVHEGTYDGKLILRYGEKSTERNIELKITDDSIEVSGLTGHVVIGEKGTFSLTNILIIVIILLVLINIIWFFLIRRIIKKRR
ncbi:MAG: hypothetical protein PVJ67_07235 [Candidatus Pacearchaeota archaeon]|jgi:hypothetical protein